MCSSSASGGMFGFPLSSATVRVSVVDTMLVMLPGLGRVVTVNNSSALFIT